MEIFVFLDGEGYFHEVKLEKTKEVLRNVGRYFSKFITDVKELDELILTDIDIDELKRYLTTNNILAKGRAEIITV